MIPVMHFNKAPVLKIDNNVWKICDRVIVIAPHSFCKLCRHFMLYPTRFNSEKQVRYKQLKGKIDIFKTPVLI